MHGVCTAAHSLTTAVLQALALCLLAFATLDHSPGPDVLAAVQQRVLDYAVQFDTQAIANCLWALALLQALPQATWNALVGAFVTLLSPQQSLPGGCLPALHCRQGFVPLDLSGLDALQAFGGVSCSH